MATNQPPIGSPATGTATAQQIADALTNGTKTPQGVAGIPKRVVDLANQLKNPTGR